LYLDLVGNNSKETFFPCSYRAILSFFFSFGNGFAGSWACFETCAVITVWLNTSIGFLSQQQKQATE
jgi:hypothetical protein